MKMQAIHAALEAIASAVAAGAHSMTALRFAHGAIPTTKSPVAKTSSSGSVLTRVHGVLTTLVTQGTISETQADAVQRQANAGRIDPRALVQSRILTAAQVRLVASGIEQVELAGK